MYQLIHNVPEGNPNKDIVDIAKIIDCKPNIIFCIIFDIIIDINPNPGIIKI